MYYIKYDKLIHIHYEVYELTLTALQNELDELANICNNRRNTNNTCSCNNISKISLI